jgi:hypothetical protein
MNPETPLVLKLVGLSEVRIKYIRKITLILDPESNLQVVPNNKICSPIGFSQQGVSKDIKGYVLIHSKLFGKDWFGSALMVSIGIIEILADHDVKFFENHTTTTILSVVQTLLNCNGYDEYIDLVKYSSTYMHARSLKQVLPEKPTSYVGDSAPLLFKGSVRRFLLSRIATLSDRNQHLFWSLAQVKRCAEVVPDYFIEKSLHKHRKAMDLCSDPVEDDFKISLTEKFDNIIEKITFRNIDTVHEYSTSACWEASTVSGGAKAYLQHSSMLNGHTSNDELLMMSYHPRKGVMQRRGFTNLELRDLISDAPSSDEMCQAKVYPICEPLKVRNITKSNAHQYAIAKGMQMDMHSSLKKYFQFNLVGAPCEIADIQELCDRSPSGVFASGDFSAATDNVKIELTKLFFERLIFSLQHQKVVDTVYIKYLRRVLYEHEIHYPTNFSEDKIEPVIQKNGQLMGSVLSFMVLCAINIATYWHSVEPEVEDFTHLNVKVNGDDILFRTSIEKYNTWLQTLPKAGLFPSPGKNFFHEKYCTVNSALFSVSKNNTVKYIPFFNVGMLLGQSKVCRTEFTDKYKSKPVHCLHSKVMHGAYNTARANDRFCYYNKELLAKATLHPAGFNCNYYLPREYGGLGMKVPNLSYLSSKLANKLSASEKVKLAPYTIVTSVQAAIAIDLYNKWTTPYVKPPMKPIGREIDLDCEDNNFKDVSDVSFKISIPGMFNPMPMHCREKHVVTRPPNWSSPPTDSPEMERLKFEFRGVKAPQEYYQRSEKKWNLYLANALCKIQEHYKFRYLIREDVFTEYRWIGKQPILRGIEYENVIQPYDLKIIEREYAAFEKEQQIMLNQLEQIQNLW